jgi:hypothetical protein
MGSTVHTPEERWQQHKDGKGKYSRKAHKYGRELRPEFYHQYPRMTRAEEAEEEVELAALLRREGYPVWQN